MTDTDNFTKIAEVGDIPVGEGEGFDIGGIEIAVFNTGDEYYAISNRCSHQHAPLCNAGDEKINAEDTWTGERGGVDTEACTVSCPWHLWEWDLETGEHEASGQRIGTFDCRVEEDDILVRI
ncbi:Rieske (2Fe-2S) protein [Halostagnicola kamekurae]|uniref:Nitrite reductase (NADH) small subunit n=1 Tax=Halostagnicola kamekurae TaxID=619731 RepID=A0A1I6TM39_9EURY|nr:Rieske 2Fe-2S domain-containing protein [Halostagnicola kamekurae]SFS90234.1 nitrite reductase (NADH) small subunit [Halostagnicola kamekurae]